MGILTDLLGGGLLNTVKEVADEFWTSDEEKLELEIEKFKAERDRRAFDIKEQSIYLEDTQSARDMNTRVNESSFASWLTKNIASMLASGTIILTFLFFYLVIFGEINTEKRELVMYILGALSAMAMTIFNFYFGSSAGSKAKTDQMDKVMNAIGGMGK